MQQPPSQQFFQFSGYIPHSQAGYYHAGAVHPDAQHYAPSACAAPFGAPAGVPRPVQPATNTTPRSYIPQQSIHVPGATSAPQARHPYAPALAAPPYHATGTALPTSAHLDPQAPTFTPVRTGPPCPIPIVRPPNAAAPSAAPELVEPSLPQTSPHQDVHAPPSRPSTASSVTQVEHTPERDEGGAQRMREDAVRAFADGLVRHVEKQAAFEDELERVRAQCARECELKTKEEGGMQQRDAPPHVVQHPAVAQAGEISSQKVPARRDDEPDTQTQNPKHATPAAGTKLSESAPATQPELPRNESRKKNKKSKASPASGANAVPVSVRASQARPAPVKPEAQEQPPTAPAPSAERLAEGPSQDTAAHTSTSRHTPVPTPADPLATFLTSLSALATSCTARPDGAAHFATEVQRCMAAATEAAATAASMDGRALLADVLLATAAAAAGTLRLLAMAPSSEDQEKGEGEEKGSVCVDGENVVAVGPVSRVVDDDERVDGPTVRDGAPVPHAAGKAKGKRGKKVEKDGWKKGEKGKKGKKSKAKAPAAPATGGKKKKGKGYKA